ncbi:hypothetical protein OOK41_31485 [Micromonospora sp. NBC_01655]|uniref:hypothetical protein n=1 Tax=Micromonospora sp. NBC_01655 TaxID=2975983 RepID=UPI00224D782E|nr:hypothetical protein [Micromonospora sp. NBC_01655]MCX4474784.1 hypothetical protein [Micromonospora sp. NBC_01655]
MRHHPYAPGVTLVAIVAGTAAVCWAVRSAGRRVRAAQQPDTRLEYWRIYSDVLEDLCGLDGSTPRR